MRDYIHVSDLADIHVLSLEHLLKTQNSLILNCGYGYGYSVKSIIDKIGVITGEKLNVKIDKRRKGDAISLVADIKKLKKVLNWKPKYNKLENILDSAIKWEKKLLDEKIL